MPDREKVMNSLELCIQFNSSWNCRDRCPYYGETECNCYTQTQIMKDALELLKAPEPKLLTLDELRDVPSGTVLWCDMVSSGRMPPIYPVCYEGIKTETYPDNSGEFEVVEYTDGMDDVKDYGIFYRLWTARPTEEQRKGVKWDATD